MNSLKRRPTVQNGQTNGAIEVKKVAVEENTKAKSVLQAKLSNLAIQIGYIGILLIFLFVIFPVFLGSVVALLTVIILIVKFCIGKYITEGKPFEATHISTFLDYIIIGVTVLVIAVPEGLPLAITLSLTYSVKKVPNI